MTQAELYADILARDLELLNKTLADFTDADMLARPTPAANHAAWQIGHLIVAEGQMISAMKPGAPAPELPAGFAEKFKKETASIDDPAFFPSKAELLKLLQATRAAATPERVQSWCPTVGHLAVLLPSHTSMHIGQFQVIRRKLGKPLLF